MPSLFFIVTFSLPCSSKNCAVLLRSMLGSECVGDPEMFLTKDALQVPVVVSYEGSLTETLIVMLSM